MANKYNPNSVWTGKQNDPAYKPGRVWDESPARHAKESTQTAPSRVEPVAAKEEPFFKKRSIESFDNEPPKRHVLLWSVIGFVVLVAASLIYLFFLMPPAGPRVSIEFPKSGPILVGDPFIFSVSLSNYSSNILKNATLSVYLPQNVSAVEFPGQRVIQQIVGDLGPGGIYPKDIKLIVTGSPNSVQHIDTKLSYTTDASSKSEFETDGGVDLVVGGPAISLNFNAPTNIFSGQNFDMTVTYNNNTSHNFQNVQLAMQYPPVFSYVRSSMVTNDPANHTWNLGTISAAGNGTITITGNIIGPEKASYSLAGNLSGDVEGNNYDLIDQTANLTISSSPLQLDIALNNTSDTVVQAGQQLDYIIHYQNNSNTTFQNAVIKATFVGDMFNFSSLQTNGAFSSITNTVTWSPANTAALSSVAPGETGSVEVKMTAKSAFPIRLLSDKNYTLKANVQIASPTVPPGTVASSTTSAVSIENKLKGAVALTAKGYWRDAGSGILNSGPYPPRVNKATQYTIHWNITNYSTDLQNVTVSATLQSGTTCTDQIKSNVSTAPVCNPANGMITWQLPSLPATTGLTGPTATAIIQVINTPAVNQVSQSVILLGQTTLQATDAFTGSTLQASAQPVTTDLPDDKTVASVPNRQVAP